jgi:hypothetical protein
LIGLDLVARHPEQVRLLIAHEPPAWELLPEAERDRATRAVEDAANTFQREGVVPAFKKFVELAAVDYADREPDAVLAPPTSQRDTNLSFFFTYDLPAVQRYRLDVSALKAASTRIVPAGGRSAPESAPYRAAAGLAAVLGEALSSFRRPYGLAPAAEGVCGEAPGGPEFAENLPGGRER